MTVSTGANITPSLKSKNQGRGRCLPGMVAFLLSVALLAPLMWTQMASAGGEIAEYGTPSAGLQPQDITAGPDNCMWFFSSLPSKIGKITTDGKITEYKTFISKEGYYYNPSCMTSGPGDSLWFGGQIGYMHVIMRYIDKKWTAWVKCDDDSVDICQGPDGTIWWTQENCKVCWYKPGSKYFYYHSWNKPVYGDLKGITEGPDRRVWFCESKRKKIGSLDRNGHFKEFKVAFSPNAICKGPDGALWFTNETATEIGRISTGGKAKYFPTNKSYKGRCQDITTGTDGALWFCIMQEHMIGRMSTGGVFSDFDIPTVTATPYGIAKGPDGGIWFTEWSNNKIGRVAVDGGASTFYFAEGTCRPGFDTYFCIQNPGEASADVKLTYMRGNGSTVNESVTVGPHARVTANPKAKLEEANDAAHDFSTKVECTNRQGIVVERPMYFNYKPGTNNWNGGHNVIGALQPQDHYYFAEGSCRPGLDPYFCIQNPNNETASVTLTYMRSNGNTVEDKWKIGAHTRKTINPKDKLGEANDEAHDFSTFVECTNGLDIIAERPMYFNYKPGNLNWNGGHDIIGAAHPRQTYYFAEGTCRPGFDPYICIQNPAGGAANVTVTYMKGDKTTAVENVTVNSETRKTINPKNKLGEANDEAHDFSAKVECTNGKDIIAERPMYFNYKSGVLNWNGGHDVLGAQGAQGIFYFAEGSCRPGFDTYFCIQNPSSKIADVTVTYMRSAGGNVKETRSVAPNSRTTVTAKQKLGEANDAAHDFSTKIECTNGQAMIVERPMYFNYQPGVLNWNGGHDVIGF